MMKVRFLVYLSIFIIVSACGSVDKKNINLIDTTTDEAKKQDSLSIFSDKTDSLTPILRHYPLASWPRASAIEIGCMLEKEFSYRDSLFNCSRKKYINHGDPCENTREYYEGVRFPPEFASAVHPAIKEISLEFEHGDLREISITLVDSFHRDSVRAMFQLPNNPLPSNLMQITYGENVYSRDKPKNPDYTRWLNLYGFEHMGAGDVDCGDK